jgi:excisionase family DNA binding protein
MEQERFKGRSLMPVIRRKLVNAPAPPRAKLLPPTPIRKSVIPQPQWQPDGETRGMNVRAAAKYLGVSVWEIRRKIREGVFPSFKLGNKNMVDRADIDAFIDRAKAA